MNTYDIISKAKTIIARTDVDRSLMLFFINSIIKGILRDKSIHKFYSHNVMTHTSGVIDGTTVKSVADVFYTETDSSKLLKIPDYKTAIELFPDFTVTGTPLYYFEDGTNIRILPVPTTGKVTVAGEFWPSDLTDSIASSNILSVEIPEALVYLGASEYFDYYDETTKGNYWRQKGMTILDSYIRQSAKQTLYKINIDTDPLGNGGI